jgi:hypothetical protein
MLCAGVVELESKRVWKLESKRVWKRKRKKGLCLH